MAGVKAALGRWLHNRAVGLGYEGTLSTRKRRDRAMAMALPRDEDRLVGSYDRGRLRQECTDLRRNSPIVAGLVERFADNVVGSGITPQAKTSDNGWNKAAELYWANWSKICDSRNYVNMREMQRVAIQLRMIHGDLGFVLQENGQLFPVESERLITPKKLNKDERIIDGVAIGKGNIPYAYFIGARDKNGNVSDTETMRISADDFIFLARRIRFDQVRGVPDLAPVVNALRDLGEINDGTVQKSKLDAMMTWFIPREGGVSPRNLGPRNSGDDGGTPLEKVDDGMIYYGRPGDGSPKSLASETPNAQYVEFVKLLLKIIGAALGIPYQFLLLDFSDASFSSSRAALLQTYRTFTTWQEWLVSNFLQRAWNWQIAKAVKAGSLAPAPTDAAGVSEWYKVQWSFPEYGWVDPQAQAQADLLEFQLGKQSLTGIVRKTGRDAEDVLGEKAGDIAAAARIAAEINATSGTNLTWRDLITAQIPGQQTAVQADKKLTTAPIVEGD